MLQRSRSSGCNDWNGNTVCNCSRQFQIVSGFCSVTIHTGQKNFSCSKLFHFLCPLYSIDSNIDSSAILINIPSTSVCSFLCIDSHNNTLTSKLLGCICDQLWVVDCRRIDRNLICTFAKQYFEVLYCADSSANCKWDKYTLCNFTHHVNDRISSV